MVTISRAKYEEKNARLASQDERISRLESQIELPTEALRLARHKRFGASSEKTDESSMEQVEHRLEGEDLVYPQCGDTMTEIGKEVVKTLEIIPAQYIVREDISYTYVCPNCNREDIETPVVKSPREKNIIPGSFATPESIAHIMTQKFVMGSPLHRQEQEIDRKGIKLSRQTMSNWIR